jgi:hypothetical protein
LQQEFFENEAAAFACLPCCRGADKAQQTITRLEEKRLQFKAQVIAEIMKEMVRAKKELGRN